MNQRDQIDHNLESPLNQTKSTLKTAISGAKSCLVPHQTKLNESQILIDDASQLQTQAHHFEERLFNFNALRNSKHIEQLTESNNELEDTLSLVNDYVQICTSTRSSMIKSILKGAAPLLPPIIFALYESMMKNDDMSVELPHDNEDIDIVYDDPFSDDYYGPYI